MLMILLGLFCMGAGAYTISYREESDVFLWSMFWGLAWIALGVFLIGTGVYDVWVV